jgi:hypothetical protein
LKFGITATIVAIFLTISAYGQAATDSYEVPVADFSGVNGLQDYVTENLSSELKGVIRERGLAVWAYATDFELQNNNYCVAIVGLTYAETKDRNARWPAYTASAYARRGTANWNAGACRGEQLKEAIGDLNKSKLDDVLWDIDSTQTYGGTRPVEKEGNSMTQLSSTGLSNAGNNVVFSAMDDYPTLFDYRYVQTFVSANAFKLKDGERFCVAIAGQAARSANDRQSRSPAYTVGYINVQQQGDEDACKNVAAAGAVRALFDEPWTAKGILKDFSRTREDGIPLPNVNDIAKKRAASLARARAQARANQVRAQSTQRNTTNCTNDCVNGSCVRTFPNGRKERWQAPRIYDPFSGDWKWDTNSCGG